MTAKIVKKMQKMRKKQRNLSKNYIFIVFFSILVVKTAKYQPKFDLVRKISLLGRNRFLLECWFERKKN